MTTLLQLSHIKKDHPSMVDISPKVPTMREATATTLIKLPAFITDSLENGELHSKKGPVFHTAVLAGTMAVKHTSSLIPLAHTLLINHVDISITMPSKGCIAIDCTVKSFGQTGVEMESLMGASVAALTIYDMCKSLTFDMEIVSTKLIKKTGGKHDR